MKGVVFTELLALVEDKYGLEMVDVILQNAALPSGGIYTAVGTYNFSEMLAILTQLSTKTRLSIDALLEVYAEHFFGVIETSYPGLLAQYSDPIELLSSIEDHIHVEVKKIYPDAELPTFTVIEKTENMLVMLYKSSRAMYSFGKGLMTKTFDYFKCKATIILEKLDEEGTEVKFIITTHG